MIIARKAWLLVGLLLVSANSSTVEAQDSFGLGFAYMYGYGATNLPYIQSYIPAPPYFSLHPPVYYGKRYNRPFGDSPFASWPQLQAASNYRPRPAVPSATLDVPSSEGLPCPTCQLPGSTTLAQSAIEPLIVENPYYVPTAQTRLAQHGATSGASFKPKAPVAP